MAGRSAAAASQAVANAANSVNRRQASLVMATSKWRDAHDPRALRSYTRVFGWWLSLLVVAAGAKLALLGLRIADDGHAGVSGGWAWIALFAEDLRVATFFAGFAALTG